MKFIKIILAVILLSGIAIYAYEKGQHRENEWDVNQYQITSSSSVKLSGDSLKNQQKVISRIKKYKIRFLPNLLEQIHNKLVYFPIALSIAAFLLSLYDIRQKKFAVSIKFLLVFALVMTAASIVTGLNQASDFIGDPKKRIVDVHKMIGFFIAGFLVLWFIAISLKNFKKYAWMFGLVVTILVTIDVFLGGVISE